MTELSLDIWRRGPFWFARVVHLSCSCKDAAAAGHSHRAPATMRLNRTAATRTAIRKHLAAATSWDLDTRWILNG